METHSSCFMVLLSLVYLCLTVHPVLAGKCRGRWDIHACYGGKRSDPVMTEAEVKRIRSNLLRNLLTRNSYEPREIKDTQNESQMTDVSDSLNYKNYEMGGDDTPARVPDVNRLLSLMRLLKRESKLRREDEDEE